MKFHIAVLFDGAVQICEHIKAVQTDSLLKKLLKIGNHFLVHMLDAVLHFLCAGQNDLCVRGIIKDRASVFQKGIIFIEPAFHHVIADEIQIFIHMLLQQLLHSGIVLGQLIFQRLIRLLHQFGNLCICKQQITGRDNHGFLYDFNCPLCRNIKEADAFHDIIEKLYTQRMVIIHGIHINDSTACRIAQWLINTADMRIACFKEKLLQILIFNILILL